MFEQFPKTRPPLPPELEAVYAEHYRSNREGETSAASLAQRMESWLHRQVAADVAGRERVEGRTLELGAGTLNQLQYEPGVQHYDIVEPFTELFEHSSRLARIANIYSDISEIPGDTRYQRITSVAVLEHVCDLPQVVARSGLLLAEGGCFRAAIPNEGRFLWTVGWKMTTGLEFRLKHGLDYGIVMRHEHVNSADEIEQVLRYLFADVSSKLFGVSKNFALYRYYECRDPQLERCQELL